MQNARLDEAQAGITIAWKNINNLRYADENTLIAESEELKSLLMKVKEETEKVGFKLNIQKIKIMVIQAYAPTSNTEEAEVEWFCEDLQDLVELTPKKDVFFIIGDWNAQVGSQEIPGITGKFGLGVQNEAGQRLIEFCQENTLVIANTLFQQHKR